jgi:hypothetical protein
MFLRHNKRIKDGKTLRYWSVVENRSWNAIRKLPNASPDVWNAIRKLPNASPDVWNAIRKLPNAPPNVWNAIRKVPNAPPNVWNAIRKVPNAPPDVGNAIRDFPNAFFAIIRDISEWRSPAREGLPKKLIQRGIVGLIPIGK